MQAKNAVWLGEDWQWAPDRIIGRMSGPLQGDVGGMLRVAAVVSDVAMRTRARSDNTSNVLLRGATSGLSLGVSFGPQSVTRRVYTEAPRLRRWNAPSLGGAGVPSPRAATLGPSSSTGMAPRRVW